MSRIKVDALQGTSGSDTAITLNGANATVGGTLAVTGIHTVGTNAVATSDGGAATTSIVQGLAKMWVHFAGSGSQTVGDSFNHASITDDATGRYTVVYTNNMANDDYSGSYDATAVNNNSGEATYIQTYATSSISVKHYENGTNYDAGNNVVTVHGDLA